MVLIGGVPTRQRLGSAYAQATLAEALFEIVHEAIDPALSGPEAAAARAWLRVSIEPPILCATDAALDRFCTELELLIDAAPASFRTSLSRAADVGDEPVAEATTAGRRPASAR